MRKVALLFGVGRYPGEGARLGVLPQRFVPEKEEHSVLPVEELGNVYRAAHVHSAAPIPHRTLMTEAVLVRRSVQNIVLAEREDRAMELVSAGLGGHVDDAPAHSSIFRAVGVHFDG